MISEMLPVVIGGLLAIVGGSIQSYLSIKSSAKQKRMENREDAYLGYIDALLKLKVDDHYGTVKATEFWNTFHGVQAKLRLYGSANIIDKAKDFECHLYECWECGNMDIGNTEELKMALVSAIRKELHIA